MSLARKFAPRKSPVSRVSKPTLVSSIPNVCPGARLSPIVAIKYTSVFHPILFICSSVLSHLALADHSQSNGPRSNKSLSPRLTLQALATVTSESSDYAIDTTMSHLAALQAAQAAPEADMSPTNAIGGASANESTARVWDDTLEEGQRQITMLYTKLGKCQREEREGKVPDAKVVRNLEARKASTESFLFYLEFDYPAESYANLQKTKIPATLKLMKERRGDGVLPPRIADKCAELYDMFEEENWGAQENGEDASAEELALESAATNSPRRRQPPVRTQGSVVERLPPTDHAIWGLGGIMYGLMQGGVIRRSYRFDPRYIAKKTPAKVFGDNDLVPGDWWPLVHVALFHGAHGAKIKGIAGHPDLGAWSIIVSENPKYANLDSDDGETIFYSGDDSGNKSNRDTILESSPGTKSLQKSRRMGTPVRVLRRKGTGNNRYAPLVGIRYDGLYRVVDEYEKTRPGQGGKFLQFKLVRLPDQRDFRETIRAAPTPKQQADFWKIQEGY